MISGYNTDVRHNEVVFHVQTEDKGLANPWIESLIYVGGQVLAAKRASYAALLADGKSEQDIIAVMEHQHRVMIAAIRSGKFDEKFEALLGQGAARPERRESGVEVAAPPALAGAPGGAEAERTLDQVILEYLNSEAEQEQLSLAMDPDAELAPGGRAGLTLRTTSSRSGHPVAGAQVVVKMISTVSQPRTLAAGQTDERGCLELALDIPRLDHGMAALIITAASAIGNAELKHFL
jgi:hypothetical protein